MPEDIQPQTPPAAPAVTNTDVKAKLEAQVLPEKGATETDLQHSSDALDAIAKTVVEKKELEPAVAQNGEVVPAADPAIAEAEAAAKAKADAERAETLKKSEAYFKDSPSLPSGASPKSSEAFSAIKIKAAQEISARDTQLEEVRKQLAEAEAKLNAGPDPEVLKELEDHRQWRAKLDVDADPKFKEFDKQVSASQEFIYAQLRKSPAITADVIDQIKKLGGPENVNLEKIFAAVKDPTLQRIVEAKVADIEMAKFSKEQAIEHAKKNVGEYVAQQQKAYQENVGAHNKNTQTHFSQLTTKLPWFTEKTVDPKADEPTRKAAEAHNKFLAETKTQLNAALQDDSPYMRAIMLAGMAQLMYIQKVREGELTASEATKKELAEVKAQLEKFTKASVSRLRETGAPPGGRLDTKPKDMSFNSHAGDALDAIAKQVMAERALKASA